MTAHVGDLVSAHLDGELSEDEAAAFDAHVAGCADCRAELDGIAAVRDTVRAAPAVDAPFGFYERLLRARTGTSRRPWWTAAATAMAGAAVWVAVLGFAVDPGQRKVTPPVDQIQSIVPATLGSALHRPDPNATSLPDVLVTLPRHDVFKTNGGTLVVFGESPKNWLAVLTEKGNADWPTLKGGLRSPVEGVPGNPWQSNEPGAIPAMVYQAGDSVVTVTGTVTPQQLVDVARQLGDPAPPSTAERLRDACASVLDGFSLR